MTATTCFPAATPPRGSSDFSLYLSTANQLLSPNCTLLTFPDGKGKIVFFFFLNSGSKTKKSLKQAEYDLVKSFFSFLRGFGNNSRFLRDFVCVRVCKHRHSVGPQGEVSSQWHNKKKKAGRGFCKKRFLTSHCT